MSSKASAATGVELLEVALEVSRSAGRVLLDHVRERRGVIGTKASETDPVTEADLASERTIVSELARLRPGDGILGEEGADRRGDSGLRWVVDPLDGTVGYAYGQPHWCVSIACETDPGDGLPEHDPAGLTAARAICGVVHDPAKGETFTAVRGGGAFVHGAVDRDASERLEGSGCPDLSMALVATGYGYDRGQRARQAEVMGPMVARIRDVRRFGSAALDLCWTAAGRLDAYVEHGLKPWDTAAGALIAREAGLVVEAVGRGPTPEGEEGFLPAGVLAAPAEIAGPLRAIADPVRADEQPL